MKVAIVDHMVNYGGGSRVLRCLLPAIRQLRPEWKLVFYGNRSSLRRDGLEAEFKSLGIEVKSLKSVELASAKWLSKVRGAAALLGILQRRYHKLLSYLPFYFSGAVHLEFAKISKKHDLLFCPWPYLVKSPEITTPMVAIFHDFNFRYYFNGPSMHPAHFKFLEKEIPKWLSISTPIVSTHFMKRELEKFYPEFKDKAEVIHLSSLGAETKIDRKQAQEVVAGMGISGRYILYPTNTSLHKNLGNLISAFYLLREKYPDLKLVFAGFGTEVVNGKVQALGLEVGMENRDVIGLGYISNLEMDALIQSATLVVSTSLYEAGCGPGLDAWLRGVPVAMSDIPPFTEHLEVQGVEAQVFDPRSPKDIAEKIDAILKNPEKAAKSAQVSQTKLAAYDWKLVAQKYIDTFERAYGHSNSSL